MAKVYKGVQELIGNTPLVEEVRIKSNIIIKA